MVVTPSGAGKATAGRPFSAVLHERRPDGGGGVAARVARAQPAGRVVAHPHAGDEVGREADEPRIAIVVGGAGLAGDGTVDLRPLGRCPV